MAHTLPPYSQGLFHCNRGTLHECTMARRDNLGLNVPLPFYPDGGARTAKALHRHGALWIAASGACNGAVLTRTLVLRSSCCFRGERFGLHAQSSAMQRYVPTVRAASTATFSLAACPCPALTSSEAANRAPPHRRFRPPSGRSAARTRRTAQSARIGRGCTLCQLGASFTVRAQPRSTHALMNSPHPSRIVARFATGELTAEMAINFPEGVNGLWDFGTYINGGTPDPSWNEIDQARAPPGQPLSWFRRPGGGGSGRTSSPPANAGCAQIFMVGPMGSLEFHPTYFNPGEHKLVFNATTVPEYNGLIGKGYHNYRRAFAKLRILVKEALALACMMPSREPDHVWC